jgi:predicted metalloendopeptidase
VCGVCSSLLQINDAESLPEKVRNEFTAKTHCLIEQYGQYREPQLSEALNGKRTAIENFADNTGINLAYRAYRSWSEKFHGKRQTLIGLEYTWDQLFWLSAAQTWCGVYRRGIKTF